jgi:hypothetical protein
LGSSFVSVVEDEASLLELQAAMIMTDEITDRIKILLKKMSHEFGLRVKEHHSN